MTNTVLQVSLPAIPRQYPIYIEPGGLVRVGALLREHLQAPCKVLVVSDPVVEPLYGSIVMDSLRQSGFEVSLIRIPEGETAKSFVQAERIYDHALRAGLSRKDILLALGGGVVGDLTGFCAATYFRGIPFVQVPTTLLAQVDSSVGGKVAVNFRSAKNAVGAFYQPLWVLADPDVLHSLPPRQLKAGLAEVAKYSLIETTCTGATGFFEFLTTHAQNLAPVLSEMIYRCCQLKASVVTQDETESLGIRTYLNLGHTFAHAYEEITDYRGLLHGEAVGIGLVKACTLATQLGHLSPEVHDQIVSLLSALDLVVTPPERYPAEELLALMRHDKKASGGQIQFVLPYGEIGQVLLRNDISDADVLKIL